jgi:hypothetical protein
MPIKNGSPTTPPSERLGKCDTSLEFDVHEAVFGDGDRRRHLLSLLPRAANEDRSGKFTELGTERFPLTI